MKILIIDNYDSFTFNLYQHVGEILEAEGSAFTIEVKRNDEIALAEIQKSKYNRIIISPGPGSPDDHAYFGVCAGVLTIVGRKTPVLGVCLGMQGMAHYFGGKVIRARLPMHGKLSSVLHDGKGVFKGLPQGIQVMRYHSLVADPESLPKELVVTATVLNTSTLIKNQSLLRRVVEDHSEIMGLRHATFPVEGIQFHPESFATEGGKKVLANFLCEI